MQTFIRRFAPLILTALAIGQASAASVDPFNTYLWNRQNVLAGNGEIDRGDWFEWWYYKVIDPVTDQAFFFTYGVVNPWDSGASMQGTKAVMQVGDFQQRILATVDFPVEQFSASYDKTAVSIGENTATDTHIQGHVREKDHEISWDLSLAPKWKFAAMGWSMSLSDLSGIYWYPAQASAAMTGWIKFDGRTVNFSDAPAYQDRNWGRSFPKWWTWLTSNHFKNAPGVSFAAGGGQPKFFNSVYLMSGLCLGLNYEGHDYIFRTVDADFVSFDIHWGVWKVEAENSSGERIEVSAYAPPEKFMMLPFQSPRGPVFYDYEALTGEMTVKLFKRASIFDQWHLVKTFETSDAGIEWGTPEPLSSFDPFSFMGLFNSSTKLQ